MDCDFWEKGASRQAALSPTTFQLKYKGSNIGPISMLYDARRRRIIEKLGMCDRRHNMSCMFKPDINWGLRLTTSDANTCTCEVLKPSLNTSVSIVVVGDILTRRRVIWGGLNQELPILFSEFLIVVIV